MRRPTFSRCLSAVGAVALAGCLNTVTIDAPVDGAADATPATDLVAFDAVAPPDATVPRDVAAPPDVGRDAGFPSDDGAVAEPERCGEDLCASGEACCLGTGRCFDPVARPDLCPRPAPDGSEGSPCNAHSQCAASEFCVPSSGLGCIGSGHCHPRDNCGSCSGPDGACMVCGCDGRTYTNGALACHLGVRGAGAGACGAVPVVASGPDAGPRANPVRIACAFNAQCPSGQNCCPWLGVCVDATCTDCCRAPPAGTTFPCQRDEQCFPTEYCAGDGCGTPGGCTVVRGTGGCSGVVTQVCGCDGRSYINACWATGVGVRVASTSACP